MRRARHLALVLLLGCALASAVGAQEAATPAAVPVPQEAAAEPGTGNAWIDARLHDMDRYAARHRAAFVDEIVRYLEAPRALVDEALAGPGVRPGEVYYACALARASGRSCRTVVEAWQRDPSGGWAGVADRLGLESEATLHPRIRELVAASYRRWARPLDVEPPRTR